MSTPALVQAAGAFSTRRFVIPAGGEAQFDADAVQLLITELDNASEITLQLNHGQAGRAWKGFEATGRIVYVRAVNDAADPVTVEFLTVSPGLVVRDRRLNQVGDLGLVTAFASFLPLGAVVIPGNSARQLCAADPDRRYTLISNAPGQFREIYLSGAEFGLPEAGLLNGDFETGDLTSWTVVNGTWAAAAGAAFSGAFGARMSATAAARILRQSVDLLARGFDAADIDAGGLVVDFEGRTRRNSGLGDTRIRVQFRDAADLLISELDSGVLTPAIGNWTLVELDGTVPALTRHIRVDLEATASGAGATDYDDLVLVVDGVPAAADTLAGFVMPAESRLLPTSGAIYGFNPHATSQEVLVGEIRAT